MHPAVFVEVGGRGAGVEPLPLAARPLPVAVAGRVHGVQFHRDGAEPRAGAMPAVGLTERAAVRFEVGAVGAEDRSVV